MMNIFAKVSELLDKQETVAVVTIINHRGSVPRQLAKMCVTKKGETFGTVGGGCVEGQVVEEAAQMLRSGTRGVAVRSYDLIEEEFGGVGMNCGGKVEFSIEVVEPTPQLIVAGSGHLSSAIARLADALGFEVTVVDAMAERKHFPTAKLVVADFVGTHFQDMHITESSQIVVVTRHKDDLPSLRAALGTNAGYIGLVGSRRRVLQTFQQLLSEGFTEKQLERVNAPVGLNIGAETPEEIAVSILAEIIQRRRTGANIPAEPMKVNLESVRAAAATRSSNRDQEQSENCNYLGP